MMRRAYQVCMWAITVWAVLCAGCQVHEVARSSAATVFLAEAGSVTQEAEVFVVAPWVTESAVLDIAEQQLRISDADAQLLRTQVHRAIRAQHTVPPEVFADADSVDITPDSQDTAASNDCRLVQHFYVNACRDGATAWGPCSAVTDSTPPDWRLLYQQVLHETEQAGQHRVIVALSAEATAAWFWRNGEMRASQRSVEGLSECSLVVSSEAVERLFHRNIVAAGLGYSVYQEICQ